jgi:hypothetical protein
MKKIFIAIVAILITSCITLNKASASPANESRIMQYGQTDQYNYDHHRDKRWRGDERHHWHRRGWRRHHERYYDAYGRSIIAYPQPSYYYQAPVVRPQVFIGAGITIGN